MPFLFNLRKLEPTKIKPSTISVMNRLYMSMIISYRAMFAGGFKEQNESEITLQEMTSDTFDKILQYMYGKENPITTSSVEDLLKAACMLQIQPLQTNCESFMISNISTENCITIWRFAKCFPCEQLLQKAKTCILSSFEVVMNTTEYLQLEIDEMVEIISDDELIVSKEETVSDGVMNWIRNEEDRRYYALELFEHCRFPLMDPEYLFNLSKQNHWICHDLECMEILEEAKEYQLVGGRRHDICSKRTQYRKSAANSNVLVGFCISTSHDGPEYHVRMDAYSFQTKKVKFICWVPEIRAKYFAACTYFDDIILSGGINKHSIVLKDMMKFSIKDKQWTRFKKLPEEMFGHALVPMGGNLLTIGGRSITSIIPRIHCFEIASNTWQEAGRLCIPVWNIACKTAVLSGKIYICGGYMNIRDPFENCTNLYKVQAYDFQTQQCTEIIRLPLGTEITAAFTSGDTIFLNKMEARDFSFAKIECNVQPGQFATYTVQTLRNVLNRLKYTIHVQAAFLYDNKWFLNVKCIPEPDQSQDDNLRKYQMLCTAGELNSVQDNIKKFHLSPLFKYYYVDGVPLLRTVLPKGY